MFRPQDGARVALDRVEADERLHNVQHPLIGDVRLDLLVKRAKNPVGMLVFLPSAQAQATRTNPIFHRWSWADKFPDWHVVVMSDPGLYAHDDVLGSWFVHPSLDLVAETARFLGEVAERWGVHAHQMILCGSSMGGFLSLMCASHLPGSTAVAEIPQFDLREYEIKRALSDLERRLLAGRPLTEHFVAYPHQLSVLERFRLMGHVPSLTVVTNIEDASFPQAQRLISEIAADPVLSRSHSPIRLEVVPEHSGHVALKHEQLRPALLSAMTHASESNARVLGVGGSTRASFEASRTDNLARYFAPGFSSAPGVTLHVVADVAKVEGAVADHHRYIWGPRRKWEQGRGPYAFEFLTDEDRSVILAVAYYDDEGAQIDCAFYKPGEARQHTVPERTSHAAVGIRVKGHLSCRFRLRGAAGPPSAPVGS